MRKYCRGRGRPRRFCAGWILSEAVRGVPLVPTLWAAGGLPVGREVAELLLVDIDPEPAGFRKRVLRKFGPPHAAQRQRPTGRLKMILVLSSRYPKRRHPHLDPAAQVPQLQGAIAAADIRGK